MKATVRISTVLASALVVGALLTGCGGKDTPRVATAQPPKPTATDRATAGPSPSAESDYDKALRYTRCMTEHGEPVPDPVEGVALPVSAPGKTWANTSSGAYAACKHFLPATWPVKADPKEIERERPFNECMRKNGFPPVEPDANGMYRYPTDSSAQESPEFTAAVAKCRPLLDDKANNQPDNK